MIGSSMKTRLAVATGAIWLIAATLALDAGVSTSVRCDSRTVKDMARLRFADLGAENDENAILLTHIRTAGPIQERPDFPESYYRIRVDVTNSLSGNFAIKRWEFSRQAGQLYSGHDRLGLRLVPFETPGSACAVLVVSQRDGKVEIHDTYVVPSAWEEDVAVARNYCLGHRDVFDKTRAAENRTILFDLLRGKNSLLSFTSTRVLAEDSANFANIADEIKASKDIRQAGIVLELLQSVKPKDGVIETVTDALMGAIQSSQHSSDLHGIALAAFVAGNMADVTANHGLSGAVGQAHSRNLSAAELLQPIILRSVRRKFMELDPTYSDAYVAFLVGLESP